MSELKETFKIPPVITSVSHGKETRGSMRFGCWPSKPAAKGKVVLKRQCNYKTKDFSAVNVTFLRGLQKSNSLA